MTSTCKRTRCVQSGVVAAFLAHLSSAGTIFRRLTCRAFPGAVSSGRSKQPDRIHHAIAGCGQGVIQVSFVTGADTPILHQQGRTMKRSTQCPHSAPVTCTLRGFTKKEQTQCEEPWPQEPFVFLEVLQSKTTQAQRIPSRDDNSCWFVELHSTGAGSRPWLQQHYNWLRGTWLSTAGHYD